jgi:hypothetical protein
MYSFSVGKLYYVPNDWVQIHAKRETFDQIAWRDLKKEDIIPPNSPMLVLNTTEKFLEVLVENRRGWVLIRQLYAALPIEMFSE